jgi:hypothetical protein
MSLTTTAAWLTVSEEPDMLVGLVIIDESSEHAPNATTPNNTPTFTIALLTLPAMSINISSTRGLCKALAGSKRAGSVENRCREPLQVVHFSANSQTTCRDSKFCSKKVTRVVPHIQHPTVGYHTSVGSNPVSHAGFPDTMVHGMIFIADRPRLGLAAATCFKAMAFIDSNQHGEGKKI